MSRGEPWKLKRTAQCNGCPWRVDTDPHTDIPSYDEDKHKALAATIADPNDPIGSALCVMSGAQAQRVFTCHETKDAHCIGWLANQIGRGNNIALRIQMYACLNAGKLRTKGEQHRTFEDTLPSLADKHDSGALPTHGS